MVQNPLIGGSELRVMSGGLCPPIENSSCMSQLKNSRVGFISAKSQSFYCMSYSGTSYSYIRVGYSPPRDVLYRRPRTSHVMALIRQSL